MKKIAIGLNIFLLVVVVFLLATKGMPNGDELIIFIPMVAAPICSLFALFGASGETWLSLYFKRKTLEEKQKIDQLTKKQN
jgi:hypothetical protein